MFSTSPIITETGITLLLRAAGGEQITFTRFQAGSGILEEGETPGTMTALKNPVITDIGITSAEAADDTDYLELTGAFNNQTDISEAFQWTELGLFAKDENNVEYLYAYAYEGTYAELISPSSSSVVLEQEISCVVAIGDSGNVDADVVPSPDYADQSDFNDHVSDTTNPHSTTYTQIGAAAATHTHSTNVLRGVLPIAKGGTGVTTLAELQALFGSKIACGTFTGDGTSRREINLGFQPAAVLLTEARTGCVETYPTWFSFFTRDKFIFCSGDPESMGNLSADEMFRRGHGGAAITDTGFAVGYYDGGTPGHYLNTTYINADGKYYMYFAFNEVAHVDTQY